MTAGDHQTQKRRLQLRIGDIVGSDMATDMMHRDQGLIQRQRCCFSKIHAYQHRADEAGRIGHGHRVDISAGQPRSLQSFLRKAVDGLHMLAGGDLRHHAAVDPVQLHLGSNTIAKHFSSITDDGYGSFITRRFNRQNIHTSHSFLRISASSLGFR